MDAASDLRQAQVQLSRTWGPGETLADWKAGKMEGKPLLPMLADQIPAFRQGWVGRCKAGLRTLLTQNPRGCAHSFMCLHLCRPGGQGLL